MHYQTTTFSNVTRRANLAWMCQETFDILVIGGGITGAGIASQAARRGYRVALVEKGDFASGTSSKSSKLVHGGLRYLATGEVGLVFQACQQRRELLRLAPHLVWPLPFVLPIYQERQADLTRIRAAMWLYDALALFGNVRRHRILPGPHALAQESLLDPRRLVCAAHYYDCGTDDARLTLATILDAHRAGAAIANYAEVSGLLQAGGRIVGAQLRDCRGVATMEIHARVVISAVGPWTDKLLGLRGVPHQGWLRPTRGAHIIVPRPLAYSEAALTFQSPRDGRFMFLIPWGAHAILGTTDTDYAGDLEHVYATAEDVAEILEAANAAFPSLGLSDAHVVSAYAGVRPLIAAGSTASIHHSREHRIGEIVPGLVAVAGGKLTTYRSMARAVVAATARILGRDHQIVPAAGARQRPQPLPGGTMGDWAGFQVRQLETVSERQPELAMHLAHSYGAEMVNVLELLRERPALAEPISPDLPAISAQVVHAVRHEMALTLEDVLARRTHILNLAADQGLGCADHVADVMATELGWSPMERATEIAHYWHTVAHSRRWRASQASSGAGWSG